MRHALPFSRLVLHALHRHLTNIRSCDHSLNIDHVCRSEFGHCSLLGIFLELAHSRSAHPSEWPHRMCRQLWWLTYRVTVTSECVTPMQVRQKGEQKSMLRTQPVISHIHLGRFDAGTLRVPINGRFCPPPLTGPFEADVDALSLSGTNGARGMSPIDPVLMT